MIYLHTNGIDISLNSSSKKEDFSQTILMKLRKQKRIKTRIINILYKGRKYLDNIFLNKKVALYINFDTQNEYENNKEKIKNAMSEFCSSYNIKQYKEYIDIGFIGKNIRRSNFF